ncbi:uncharacterized protein LTHEOB_9727 [Lasiodiplodia theobromae]|uniref:uncharacterized protein n=1 Tax=Lasiodiplodia theobromae TaxID=45133 RepID=UPI0015C2FFC3|nr:uncharacterized protein LTHEOB_9727 [Lasiodiplodia theobromae]KAF4539915.1 hypothetical protein LTHEOB_9727 [Lasiodiplodia theobromae]
MDPLTALGLAANIAQFVEYGIKLTSTISELYHSPDGTTKENTSLEIIVADMQNLAGALVDENSKGQGPLTILAENCYNISVDLQRIFTDLKIPQDTNHPKWQAFRQTIRAQGKANEIEKLYHRLEKNRSQLATHMIFLLRCNYPVLVPLQSMLITDSDKQSKALRTLNSVAKDTRDLTTAQDNTAKGLESLKVEVLQLAKNISKEKSLTIQTKGEVLSLRNKLLDLLNQNARSQRKNRIMRSLEFEQMRSRKTQIKGYFPRTFDWAHHDSEEVDQNADRIRTNFRHWLSCEDGVFWVAGKAGSGKSTFMKFLGEDGKEETEKALHEWGGSTRVVSAYYFFWVGGTELQRSREGMLRSLLFDILKQAPALIPTAFPSLWDEDNFDELLFGEMFDVDELLQAFKRLADQETETVKICLFVDGLDEFDASDPSVRLENLLELIDELSASPRIKLCISSRTWNEFEEHFKLSQWKFYLHDLTKTDIERLINKRMSANAKFQDLRRKNPAGCERLFSEIAERAKGVILWVVLVIDQLLSEARINGTMDDLYEELVQFPPELKDYFKLMWGRIKHKNKAARVLRVTSEAVEPLSLLALHFLEQGWRDSDFVEDPEFPTITDSELEEIHGRMTIRLEKYAKDLLQVQPVNPDGDSFLKHRVDFLHRTVVDFLRSEDMAEEIKDLSIQDEPTFEPVVALCKISLALVKSLQLPQGLGHECNSKRLNSFFALVDQVMFYAGAAEQLRPPQPQTNILDELDRFNIAQTKDLSVHWTNRRESAKGLLQEYGGNSFLALAIQMNLRLYVASKLDKDPNLVSVKKNRPLLDYALRPNIITPLLGNRLRLLDKDQPIDTKMVWLLLSKGGDPNQEIHIYDYQTPWSLFLTKCYEKHAAIKKRKLERSAWCHALALLIENGADVDRKCITYVVQSEGQRAKETKMRVDEVIVHAFAADEVANLQSLVDTKRKERETAKRQWSVSWVVERLFG